MQKRKKARVISTAMAAVVLIGVCSDFRLSFTGDKNAAQENILDIAVTGAITYASESGGAIGKSCLVSAMIGGSNLMRGVSMGEGEPLYASLFAMQEGANDIGEQFGGILDTTLDNITGSAVEGNQPGETDNVNPGDNGLPGGANSANPEGGELPDGTDNANPEDGGLSDGTDNKNPEDGQDTPLDETPDSLLPEDGDVSLPIDIVGNQGMAGSDDNLYLPGEGEQAIDEEPAPEFYVQGVSHSSVADIQQRLMDLGFMDYSEPTMYYGSITAKAVEMFQRQHELKQDGIIGPETITLLFSEDAKYYLAKVGMDGDDIKRIQRRLYEMGYLAKAEYVTGHFGDVTEEAVKQMQQNNGLLADGKVGHDTMEMLYSETAKANIVSYGDKSDVVLACQERLKTLGYLTTKPDGQYGNDTVAAVKQFQSRNDLVVDGFLGPTTMQVLNSSDAVANGMMIGESGDTVKRVQELLARYGYMSSSNCTGYFGEVTEEAVKAFQKKNGLTADGNVGMKTMAKLTGNDVVKANGGGTGSSSGKSSSSSSGNKNNSSSSSSTSSSSSSSVSTGSASVSALLKAAKSKLGKPYVYGAKGPNAFDCSGYVYWCLNQVGIKQSYVTSYGWRTIGKYQKITSFSNIKAGDIVVVRGHVGIAAGGGMVYDASSSSGKIVYRSLGAWWKNNFICAWRIF